MTSIAGVFDLPGAARFLALGLLCGAAAAASAQERVDWAAFEGARTLHVHSRDEDGAARKTKVWVVVVDGAAFVRTGGTHWGANVERDPDVSVTLGEHEIPVHAELVEDPAVRDAVMKAFRAKYGFEDWLLSPIRGRHPRIIRLHERVADS